MLFTLLMDDLEGEFQRDYWSIFYDLFIDIPTLDAVRNHARNLCNCSRSLQSWTSGPYNAILRIVNTETLNALNEYWTKYADFRDPNQRRYEAFRKQCELQYYITPRHSSTQGLQMLSRSFGPRLVNALKLTEYYTNQWWKTGTIEKDTVEKGATRQQCNPLCFYSSTGGEKFTIHYRTNPMSGFHLSCGVTEITKESVGWWEREQGETDRDNVAIAAKIQFKNWCDAFRRAVKKADASNGNLRIRFFVGDALQFCIGLKHLKDTKSTAMNIYSRPWSITPLTFDGEGYSSDSNDPAPLTFNVIDTSNLIDDVGFYNLLTSVVPLLDPSPSTVLYTETMRSYPPQEDSDSVLKELFCADILTMCTLFGIIPTPYVTGLTSRARDEAYINDSSPVLNRLTWRHATSLDPTGLKEIKAACDPEALAQILYQIYLEMFLHESGAYFERLTAASGPRVFRCPQPRCCRASFVQLLGFLKTRVSVNWARLMKCFCDHIENDDSLYLGKFNLKDLYLQLQLAGIHNRFPFGESIQSLSNHPLYPDLTTRRLGRGILKCSDPPPTCCLIVTVPRRKLQSIYSACVEGGHRMNLFFQIHLDGRGSINNKLNTFTSIQPVFGKLIEITDDMCSIEQDKEGWFGHSDLHLCLYVPTFLLFTPHPKDVDISVRFFFEMSTMLLLAHQLGPELEVFKTRLLSSEYVHLTRTMPGLDSPKPSNITGVHHLAISNQIVDVTYPLVTPGDHLFTTRINIKGESELDLLRDGGNVEFEHTSYCTVTVKLGTLEQLCAFPFPLLKESTRIRIARKSGWIEVIARLLPSQIKGKSAEEPLPLLNTEDGLLSWGLPYVNFKQLPKIGPGEFKDMWELWLKSHLEGMYSDYEYHNGTHSLSHKLKESIEAIFGFVSQNNGDKPLCVTLTPSTTGGALRIYLKGLYLDCNTNSVALEASVFEQSPGQHIVKDYDMGISSDSQTQVITLRDDVYSAWKAALPTMAERCRNYEHRPSCTHNRESKCITSLCDCFLEDFELVLGRNTTSHVPPSQIATPIAISPLFAAPYLEPSRGGPISETLRKVLDRDVERWRRSRSRVTPDPPRPNPPVPSVGRVVCGVCGVEGGKKCAACEKAIYCSRECQRKDWKKHKVVCKKL